MFPKEVYTKDPHEYNQSLLIVLDALKFKNQIDREIIFEHNPLLNNSLNKTHGYVNYLEENLFSIGHYNILFLK